MSLVLQLEQASDKLSKSDAAFAMDLVHGYKKYGKWSSKQEFWVNKLIEKAANPPKEVVKVDVGGFEKVVALFQKAKEHLNFPKVVLSCNGKKIILSLAGNASKYPGSIKVAGEGQYPNKEWFGRVSQKGEWTPGQYVKPEMQEELKKLLFEFGNDPARVAQKFGKLTGNCCFCNSELTDKRSVAAGFGPICADHFGLKDQWKMAVDKAKAKEELENPNYQNSLPKPMEEVLDFTVNTPEENLKQHIKDLAELSSMAEAAKVSEDYGPLKTHGLQLICEFCKEKPAMMMVEDFSICERCNTILQS